MYEYITFVFICNISNGVICLNLYNEDKVVKNIYDFAVKEPDFFEELTIIMDKYGDWPYDIVKYEFRDLFRILSERERMPESSEEEYSKMKDDVNLLRVKYPDAFNEFSLLIRKYVTYEDNAIGYNSFIRCINEANKKLCRKYKKIVDSFMGALNIPNLDVEQLDVLLEESLKQRSNY